MTRKRKTDINNLLRFSFICLVAILTISCEKRESYYHFNEIKNADWDINKVIEFEIDSSCLEQGVKYDVSVEITNNVDYPYQNLWLFSEYYKNDSTSIKKQEEYILADEFGKWEGAGFASLYQSSHPILTGITFPEKKNYTIYVRHGMQDTVLHGIEKVGIRIERTE